MSMRCGTKDCKNCSMKNCCDKRHDIILFNIAEKLRDIINSFPKTEEFIYNELVGKINLFIENELDRNVVEVPEGKNSGVLKDKEAGK